MLDFVHRIWLRNEDLSFMSRGKLNYVIYNSMQTYKFTLYDKTFNSNTIFQLFWTCHWKWIKQQQNYSHATQQDKNTIKGLLKWWNMGLPQNSTSRKSSKQRFNQGFLYYQMYSFKWWREKQSDYISKSSDYNNYGI